jgi:hypothetical protein
MQNLSAQVGNFAKFVMGIKRCSYDLRQKERPEGPRAFRGNLKFLAVFLALSSSATDQQRIEAAQPPKAKWSPIPSCRW